MSSNIAYRGRRTTQTRARRTVQRIAEGGTVVPNIHTHVGRIVRDSHDNPVWERVPSLRGNGRYRIKVEYVPIFADPQETARRMARAAARQARREWFAARRLPRSTGEPMGFTRRADSYHAQMGGAYLTPRQVRRIRHKNGHELARATS